jgi:Na+-transporting NADH:ubiquinone oxidoreductase subunit NqrC
MRDMPMLWKISLVILIVCLIASMVIAATKLL